MVKFSWLSGQSLEPRWFHRWSVVWWFHRWSVVWWFHRWSVVWWFHRFQVVRGFKFWLHGWSGIHNHHLPALLENASWGAERSAAVSWGELATGRAEGDDMSQRKTPLMTRYGDLWLITGPQFVRYFWCASFVRSHYFLMVHGSILHSEFDPPLCGKGWCGRAWWSASTSIHMGEG